jgi:hypothetical protein
MHQDLLAAQLSLANQSERCLCRVSVIFFKLERIRISEAPTEIGLENLSVKYDY